MNEHLTCRIVDVRAWGKREEGQDWPDVCRPGSSALSPPVPLTATLAWVGEGGGQALVPLYPRLGFFGAHSTQSFVLSHDIMATLPSVCLFVLRPSDHPTRLVRRQRVAAQREARVTVDAGTLITAPGKTIDCPAVAPLVPLRLKSSASSFVTLISRVLCQMDLPTRSPGLRKTLGVIHRNQTS